MKVLLLALSLAVVTVSHLLCTDVIDQQPVSPSPEPSAYAGLPTPPYEEMLAEVARLSKEVGIVNLKDARVVDGQIEIRIWKGFGLITPRCFVIRVTHNNHAALVVSARISGKRGVIRNGKFVYATTTVTAPRSGWDDFLTFLRQNGIGSSIELASDKTYMPDPDGETLILEMKNGSRHTMAYYADSTPSVDGKKAFAICRRIGSDFGIVLGCQQ